MKQNELFYLLALQKVRNVGDISAKKLLRHFGTAEEIFKAAKEKAIDIPDVGSFIIDSIAKFKDFNRVENEMAYIEKNHIQVTSIFDNDYPKKLFHAPDGPILFFSKGNTNWNDRNIISIVGTRNITPYGKRMVEELIEGLKDYRPVIVSGLAYGVDIEAHLNALKHDLSTFGVLGHGFQQIYPSIHKRISEDMLEKGGLITEFWSSDIVDRNNFLKRNRIIAGLSEATIIIESAAKGGSLVTADIANSYNRDVFAIPGRTSDKFSKGCNNLIKHNQAIILTSHKDIVEMLQWKTEEKQAANKQLNLFVDLNKEEQKIFDYLQQNGKTSLDELSFSLQMPISKTAQILLGLELNNVVSSLPGKAYEVI